MSWTYTDASGLTIIRDGEEVPLRTTLKFSTGMTPSCMSGEHAECSGTYMAFVNCMCSCHHVQTVDGQCASYGCRCYEHRDHPGLPYHPPYHIMCRVRILRPVE